MKQVLSVIENISIGRNFLYKWIYSHHKVNYEQYLLSEIVKKLDSLSGDNFSKKIFSYESFYDAQPYNGTTFYLPSDDDVIHIIKKYKNSFPQINEYLTRNYKYKALWKTYFEFNDAYFHQVSSANRMTIATNIKKGMLAEDFGTENLLCIQVEPKLKGLNNNEFFIEINDEFIDAAKATSVVSQNLNYFIVYVVEDLLPHKKEILSKILDLQS
ncbi:MAG: hypothetical protein WCQ95_01330 [Bacteroidota bacterium]